MTIPSMQWASTAQNHSTHDANAVMVLGVGDRLCGCPMPAVREIVGWPNLTRWPGAPGVIAGLINLRGAILTVVDLGVYLGAGPTNRNTGSIVLMESGTKTLGLAVDALYEVRRTDEQPEEGSPFVRLDVDEIFANVLA